jgi:Tfp pilus assembly protein FimT
MRRRTRFRLRSDRGVTLVELSVSMFGLAFLSAIMLSWFVGASRVDELHRSDDEVIQELRVARELLTKDIRRARSITAAAPTSLTVWLDADRDLIADDGELVTWAITTDGEFVRSTDTGSAVAHAGSLVVDASSFVYDDVMPASITSVSFHFVARLEDGGQRSMSSEISLRNT